MVFNHLRMRIRQLDEIIQPEFPLVNDELFYCLVAAACLLSIGLILEWMSDRPGHRTRQANLQAELNAGTELAQFKNITQAFELYTNRLHHMETLVENMICEEEEAEGLPDIPSEYSSCDSDHLNDCDSDNQGNCEDNSGFHVCNESFNLILSPSSSSSNSTSECSQSPLERGSCIESVSTISGAIPAAPSDLVDLSVPLANSELSLEACKRQKHCLHDRGEKGGKVNPTLAQSGEEECHNKKVFEYVTKVNLKKHNLHDVVEQGVKLIPFPVQSGPEESPNERVTGHVNQVNQQGDTQISFQMKHAMFEHLSQLATRKKQTYNIQQEKRSFECGASRSVRYNAAHLPKVPDADISNKQQHLMEKALTSRCTTGWKKSPRSTGVKNIPLFDKDVPELLEMHLKQKHLQPLLAEPALQNLTRELAHSKATPLRVTSTSPIKGELETNSCCETPFISRDIRDKLELHIQRRKLQGQLGVSEILPVSEDTPIARCLKEETVENRKALKLWCEQRELDLPPDVTRDQGYVAKVQPPKNPQTPTDQSLLSEEAQSNQDN